MYVQILRGLVKRHFLWMNRAGVLHRTGTLHLPLHEDEDKSSEKLSIVL